MSRIERRSSDLMNVLVLQTATGAFAFAALTMCPHMIGDVECVLGQLGRRAHFHGSPFGEIALHHWGSLFLLALALGHALPMLMFCLRRRVQLRVQLQASFFEAMLVVGLWLSVVSERAQVVH